MEEPLKGAYGNILFSEELLTNNLLFKKCSQFEIKTTDVDTDGGPVMIGS